MNKDNSDSSKGQPITGIVGRSLRAILDGKYQPANVKELVGSCHALAVPYLRRRLSGDLILKKTLELDTSDFAYDCIADLFAYAEAGEFPHFLAYFAAYPHEKLTEEEILSHVRRLVFSHVNQGIFRLYNEVDPSLGKILRNIKLALQQFRSLVIVERFGEPCLAPAEGDLLIQFRPMDLEEVESGLRGYLRGTENIPFMLGRLALFLQERSDVSRVVPLTSVGIVFRSIYSRHQDGEETAQVAEDKMEAAYLGGVVREAVEKIKQKMAAQYVGEKKIRPGLLEIYFAVIEKRLNLTYSGDGREKGLRELLAEHLKEMTAVEYRSKHRSRLEYLSRLTGEEVARMLVKK